MRLPRMVALGVLFVLCAPISAQPFRTASSSPNPGAALLQYGALMTAATEPRAENIPYTPQPGDILICDDFNKFRHFVYKLAGTAAPTHVCIVIADAEGKPAVLDIAGPNLITSKVVITELQDRLNSYPGDVMVRRLREPLTPDQSRELTNFAYSQAGKRFALPRVMLQVTPFTARTGLRKTLFGKTHFNRTRWFCSEIVVAAGTKAQIFDPQRVFSNATYPRDLAFDETLDLSNLYHAAVMWSPDAVERVGPVARPVSRIR